MDKEVQKEIRELEEQARRGELTREELQLWFDRQFRGLIHEFSEKVSQLCGRLVKLERKSTERR